MAGYATTALFRILPPILEITIAFITGVQPFRKISSVDSED